MKITVHVKPNARKNEVTPLGDGQFKVSVTAPPHEGKANEKLIEVLADYFLKPKNRIIIRSGANSKIKIIELN